MLRIADTMDAMSRKIWQGKKEALAAGDEAVKSQVGKGKDIMSILREFGFNGRHETYPSISFPQQ